MKRTGRGLITKSALTKMEKGHKEAREAAERNLEERLSDPEACDPVPCPHCFQFQPYMREVLARRHFGQASDLGCFLNVMGFIIGAVALALRATDVVTDPDVYWAAGAGFAMFCCGVCLSWLAGFLHKRYDPNKMSLTKR